MQDRSKPLLFDKAKDCRDNRDQRIIGEILLNRHNGVSITVAANQLRMQVIPDYKDNRQGE